MGMTPKALSELKRLALAATPGPYTQDGRLVEDGGGCVADCSSLADAAYLVAASPDVVLALISLAERAERFEKHALPWIKKSAEFECYVQCDCKWKAQEILAALPKEPA